MKIKIERKEKQPKNKKAPTIKVGTNKKLTIGLWVLLIISLVFAIYKNFTAIDIHTVHEKEIIEQQIVDTNAIESYVVQFAQAYYSWGQSPEALEQRYEKLKNYLTEELQQLNVEVIRSDIPTSSTVSQVQIWKVSKSGELNFQVLFSVTQQLTEGEQKKTVTSSYQVTVHVDDNQNMVITKNPTIASSPQKSDYMPIIKDTDGTVDAETTQEITTFLETFFKLYPTATENELTYYVSNNSLKPINKNYVFAELVNPVYIMDDGQVKASVTVRYLDQETKAVQISQFELTLTKQDNWKII
ncbi:conjugal transfer protein [Listeria monocytogenes]|uniref:conjugal transfer protein n=1 Tax=Listeria monocytogenes TaxID=1639 RepID=UPI0010E0F8A4|nr:conjugal transfer protein [Listeria monocytogenes]EAE2793842.1 conjugal transfer protein [Listeria monocytogenes]EAE4464080.1 conjugal transfer protein [Listeria monocytogenes]HCO9085470.1 conjugal transfer protein [Listeria monocytogenes]